MAKTTHGMSKSPEFRAWTSMRQRCLNPKTGRYSTYGGRGILICARWDVFENFFEDMGLRPSPDHSLDRIDNDGNYELINCRWATRSEQQRNKGVYPDDHKLPRGDEHWTRKESDRAGRIARRNISLQDRKGASNGNAKLSEPLVRVIKGRIAAGQTDTAIANSVGVRPGTIWFIRTKRNWSHIE